MGKYKAYLGWIKVMTWVTIKGGQHSLSYLQVRAWVSCYIFTVEIRAFFFYSIFLLKNWRISLRKKSKISQTYIRKTQLSKNFLIFPNFLSNNFLKKLNCWRSGWDKCMDMKISRSPVTFILKISRMLDFKNKFYHS